MSCPRMTFFCGLVFAALPQVATAQLPVTANEILDKVIAQERAEVQLLREYSPLVETYIQYFRLDPQLDAPVPDGDKYFLGRAKLGNRLRFEPYDLDASMKTTFSEGWREFVNNGFAPAGFVQMIYPDRTGFDLQHYKFDYLRREFLGEVRCLVFDVAPLKDKGRFVGRIWVEDQGYHIVRFNGSYGQFLVVSDYFNFDSWRTNVVPNVWLPAFVYTEQGNVRDPHTHDLAFRPFRAQTRLWGYHLTHIGQQEEMSQILIESPSAPITDLTNSARDYSPLQAQRAFERQAETNITDHLERQGLLAPHGEVDQILETVVNNLSVTNGLDIDPEVQCRVLMTSTLESFTIGHTIVLSRGLLDVLPDETTLAVLLAHELSHVVLAHGVDTQYAFFNTLHFDERDTFHHFEFAHNRNDEVAAQKKADELLSNSPYKETSAEAQRFLVAVRERSKDFPHLVSANLGDRLPTSWAIAAAAPASSSEQASTKLTAAVTPALPLGARIKVDPWSDELKLVKSRSAGDATMANKMAFQIAPFFLYLTRQGPSPTTQPVSGVAAKLDT